LADTNQLEMALLNLAVNARDAMPAGGQIVIAAQAKTIRPDDGSGLKPGGYIRLTVSDTGTGMDEETLRRAMEPFFTTKGVGKGTGLGLSMVLGLAEQSGGTLRLHSRKGEGTLAEIWLPAASGEAQDVTAAPAAPKVPPPRVRMHILAIDDDPLVLLNTGEMLEDMGHTVTAVGSAREALNLLHAGKSFDMVITDHAMPQMTGSQFAVEALRRSADLKVLLATGYAELPSGADIGLPRLAKPFTQADLAEAIARLTAS
jgi:CheY-like chemotaxis protein/anti-sigma regulatory factor (Ser/Thr protein kinase)